MGQNLEGEGYAENFILTYSSDIKAGGAKSLSNLLNNVVLRLYYLTKLFNTLTVPF